MIPTPPRTNLPRISTPPCHSPEPDHPMLGINPGPGWFVNKGHHGAKIHFRIPTENGRMNPAPFIRHDNTADHPQVHTTRGFGCTVYLRPFRAYPNPYPHPALTKRQEFAFMEGESFTPLVDIAVKMDGDPSLAAEISYYRSYHREVQ